MKQQYIIQKYVMAESVADAIKKSRTIPIHEAYVHTSWFDKQNFNFYTPKESTVDGFNSKSKTK